MNYRNASYHAESIMVKFFCFGMTMGVALSTGAFILWLTVFNK